MGWCRQTCEKPKHTERGQPKHEEVFILSLSQPVAVTVLLQLAKTQGQEEEFDECMKRIPEITSLMCSGNNKEKSVLVNTVCVRTEVLHLHPVWKGRLRREHSAVSFRLTVLVLNSMQVSFAGRTNNGGIRTLNQGLQMLWEMAGSGAAWGLGHRAVIIP